MLKYFFLCLLAVSCKGAPLATDLQDEETIAMNYIKATGNEKNMKPDLECSSSNLKVSFELYTREQPYKYELDQDNNMTIKHSTYNVKRDTKIYIHDWLQSSEHSGAKDLVSAYLRDNQKPVQVILVNYSSVSHCKLQHIRDMEAPIAREVAKLMRMLVKFGSLAGNLHVIGLGIGAQIAGYAGTSMSPMKIGRITALDPTYIGYIEKDPQLNNQVAGFLDVYHTSQHRFHSVKYLGNVRVYPNGGISQTAANGLETRAGGAVSHQMALQYYVESIPKHSRLEAQECDSSEEYDLKKCSQRPTTEIGERVDKKLTGNFYLKTKATPPFAFHQQKEQAPEQTSQIVEQVLRMKAPVEPVKEKQSLVFQQYQQHQYKLAQEFGQSVPITKEQEEEYKQLGQKRDQKQQRQWQQQQQQKEYQQQEGNDQQNMQRKQQDNQEQ